MNKLAAVRRLLREASQLLAGAPEPKLSAFRAAVLDKVAKSGATRSSPLRLHGAEFKAGLWLYEHDMLGSTARGFYPLKKKK